MKHALVGMLLIPESFKCSGGRGQCPNSPICEVRTQSSRRGVTFTAERKFCKRCLINWVSRNICARSFEIPKWVEELVLKPDPIQATEAGSG